MPLSSKIRWAILGSCCTVGLLFLAFHPTAGRFYCGLFIILGIILYYIAEAQLDKLLYGPQLAQNMKTATSLLKESRSILKKRAGKLAPDVIEQLTATTKQLEQALLSHNGSAITKEQQALNKLFEKYLAPLRKAAWRDFIEPIAIAVLLALMLRCFIVEAFEIPSGSMIPTLYVGDKIFVNKLSYNVRLPFFNQRLFALGQPERGDVAIFVYPLNPSDNFVKRVVGLPGDTVEVRDNFVYVNDKPLARRNLGNNQFWDLHNNSWYLNNYALFEERTGDKPYTIIQDPLRVVSNYNRHTIPAGYYFVMGDNRDNSSDSRFWGLVPEANLVGKAMFIWWSKGPDLHKERFFTWVD